MLTLLIVGVVNSPGDKSDGGEGSASNDQTTQSSTNVPRLQKKLVGVVTDYQEKFRNSENGLQKTHTREERKRALSTLFEKYSVASWRGTINQIDANSEGKGILSVRISKGVEVTTWNNAFSDVGSNTLIKKGTKVYGAIMNMSEGDEVSFSGHFLPSDVDFIKETSFTESGSMRDPVFLFKFKSVNKVE